MRHADAPGAGHVTRERVADEGRLAGWEAELAQRVREDAGIGLRPADVGGIDDHTEQRAKTEILADAGEVAVEVRDEAQPIMARELGQER